MKPKVQLVKRIKASPFAHQLAVTFVVCPEKHGCAEDRLETFHEAAISLVSKEVEKVENLGPAAEAYDPAALANSDGRHRDWNEPGLAVRRSELGMTKELKEELSVSSRVQ